MSSQKGRNLLPLGANSFLLGYTPFSEGTQSNSDRVASWNCMNPLNDRYSGPSCSKHCKLNELVSGQNINCSSKYSIKFTGIFDEKMWVALANAKATHIFSAKILAYRYTIFNDQNFNNTLTNHIVSFEQLGPDWRLITYIFFIQENWTKWVVMVKNIPSDMCAQWRLRSAWSSAQFD